MSRDGSLDYCGTGIDTITDFSVTEAHDDSLRVHKYYSFPLRSQCHYQIIVQLIRGGKDFRNGRTDPARQAALQECI